MNSKPALDRFLAKVEKTNYCWLWKASTRGKFVYDGLKAEWYASTWLDFGHYKLPWVTVMGYD